LLAFEGKLQLARALSDAGIQRAVECLHALFGFASRAHVTKKPAERARSVRASFESGDGRLDGGEPSVAHGGLDHPFFDVDSVPERVELRLKF
jgi:hypothetical protein